MDSGQQGVTSKQTGANISVSLGEYFDGRIVIAPGSGFSFCALATVPTHTVAIDLTWFEIPV